MEAMCITPKQQQFIDGSPTFFESPNSSELVSHVCNITLNVYSKLQIIFFSPLVSRRSFEKMHGICVLF